MKQTICRGRSKHHVNCQLAKDQKNKKQLGQAFRRVLTALAPVSCHNFECHTVVNTLRQIFALIGHGREKLALLYNAYRFTLGNRKKIVAVVF